MDLLSFNGSLEQKLLMPFNGNLEQKLVMLYSIVIVLW